MAIKALATISVSKEIDIKSYYRYYLSVLSTLGTPTINDETVRPPTSTIGGTTYTWSTTQPPFSTTGTYTLYFVDCTVFSDDSMKYSDVSVDSDYEASKQAYNLAYNTNEKFDNLEVGGKNLLRGSGSLPVSTTDTSTTCIWTNGLWYVSGGSAGTVTSGVTLTDPPIPTVTTGARVTATTTNTQIGIAQGGVPILAGEITHSVWAKGVAGDKIRLQPIWTNASSSRPESGLKEFTIPDNQWHRYTFTKTVLYDHPVGTRTSTADNTFCNAGYIYLLAATAGNSCYFCGNKIEYGNIATDWTIAPEDTEAFINNAAKVATNFMSFDSTGLMIYDSLDLGTAISPSDVTSNHTFRNVLIDSDSVDIRSGLNVLASFGETTTIGRTDIVGNKYLSLSPSSLGLYTVESDNHFSDFLVKSTTNLPLTKTYQSFPFQSTYSSSVAVIISSCYSYISFGYKQLQILVQHPNGTNSSVLNINLSDLSSSTTFNDVAFGTGAYLSVNYDIGTDKIYIGIKKGTDSAISTGVMFSITLTYSGGSRRELYLSGNDRRSAQLAVVGGEIYSSGALVNVAYPYSYNFSYPYVEYTHESYDYWVTSGYLTGSSKSIWFSITLPRHLPNGGKNLNISVDALELAIRVHNAAGTGTYLGPTSSEADENGGDYIASNITVNTYVQNENTISFWLSKTSAYNVKSGSVPNNVPLGIRIMVLDMTFNKAS